MGSNASHQKEKRLNEQAELVRSQIRNYLQEWAQKWFTYIEDPTEFDKICGNSRLVITTEISFMEIDRCNQYTVKGAVDCRIIENISNQISRTDKSVPFGKLDVTYKYNPTFKSVTYTITCCSKKN